MGIANSAFRMPPSAFPYASRADTGVAALVSCMEGASGGGTPLLTHTIMWWSAAFIT